MSNGNVERCATLLITRSGTTEYHGDFLFFFFFPFLFFFFFFLTRIRFRARERSGRFFGRLGDGLYRVESFVKGEEISGGGRNDPPPPLAAQLILTSAVILLPSRASFIRRVHLFGTLSAWLLNTTEVFDVSTSIGSRALCRVYGRGHATDTRRFSMKSDRSLRALLLSTVPNRLSKVTSVSLSSLFSFFRKNEISIRKRWKDPIIFFFFIRIKKIL